MGLSSSLMTLQTNLIKIIIIKENKDKYLFRTALEGYITQNLNVKHYIKIMTIKLGVPTMVTGAFLFLFFLATAALMGFSVTKQQPRMTAMSPSVWDRW